MMANKRKKILCVVGTRPEVIKMASIITQLKKDEEAQLKVLSTAQHREMLDQALNIFHIAPDIDLNIMEANQSLAGLTSKLPLPLDSTLEKEKPDFVLIQGDTTTAFLTALSCFYKKIPVGHVEAGLRTGEFYNPFPEEMNRVLISKLSTLNFAPTETAKANLLKEGHDFKNIFVTGNTVIDALKALLERNIPLDPRLNSEKKLILATLHRRENFEVLEEICLGLKTLAARNPNLQILVPVHPNPTVKSAITKILANHPQFILSDPLPYDKFIKSMQKATLILSDSGGVQEEAPYLGVPVLVLRKTTERPEGMTQGNAKLIGTSQEKIVQQAEELLYNQELYEKMRIPSTVYGDGTSGEQIIRIVKEYLGNT